MTDFVHRVKNGDNSARIVRSFSHQTVTVTKHKKIDVETLRKAEK